MRVTVLVPVYNVEQYITECARTLFAQTYSDIDYVFCNDGTPDNSIKLLLSVMEEFPDRKSCVRIITNSPNKGIGATRRRLVEAVNTDLFTFVDADDMLPATAIETLVGCMNASNADIVEGAYAFYADGNIGEKHCPYHGNHTSYVRRMMCQNILPNRLWGRLYHRRVLGRVPNIFSDGIDYSEDLSASVRLAAVTSRAWTDTTVYHYRTDNSQSYTKNVSRKSVLSYLKASDEVLRFFHRRGHLSLSLEIGLLNVYRACHDAGISLDEADNIVPYIPEHLTASILYKLLRSKGIVYKTGDFLYRVVRAIVRL